MIARDVEVTNLDPTLWKNISAFWKWENISEHLPENPNVLSILHDQGRVLRMYSPKEQIIPAIERVDDPLEMSRKLFYQYPGMSEVQVLDKHSVEIYSSKVQKIDWHALDYDDFLIRAHQLVNEDPVGLCFFPQRNLSWHGFSIPSAKNWLGQLPNPSSVIIGIFRDSAPWFSLVLRMADQKIKLISTMEYFSRFGVDTRRLPSAASDLGLICELATQHIAPVSAALICNYSIMEQLKESGHKRETLLRAIEAGEAAVQGIPLG
jgi:hypothetical protein